MLGESQILQEQLVYRSETAAGAVSIPSSYEPVVIIFAISILVQKCSVLSVCAPTCTGICAHVYVSEMCGRHAVCMLCVWHIGWMYMVCVYACGMTYDISMRYTCVYDVCMLVYMWYMCYECSICV